MVNEEYVKEAEVEGRKRRKGFQKFYIFPLLYVASVYFVPTLIVITGKTYYTCLPVVSGMTNAIVCFKYCRMENRKMLFRAAALIKISMTLFYVFGGALVALALLASLMPVPFMIILGPALAMAGSAWGWAALAFETPYIISYLYLSCKSGIMPKHMAVVHCILQFIFVADVIDIIFLGVAESKLRGR